MIYDRMTKDFPPFRGEWLGDSYTEVNGVLYRGYNNSLIDRKAMPTILERLECCVMESCFVDLDSFNYQGLPTRESEKQKYTQGKNVYFWQPCDGSVAGFGADSGWAGLNCDGDPACADAGLGVRRKKNL